MPTPGCRRRKTLNTAADQIGIERGFPGGGAGVALIRTAESLTQRDRAADASHLPAEFEVVVAGAGSILMESRDGRQLQHKRQRQEPEEESGQCRARGCAIGRSVSGTETRPWRARILDCHPVDCHPERSEGSLHAAATKQLQRSFADARRMDRCSCLGAEKDTVFRTFTTMTFKHVRQPLETALHFSILAAAAGQSRRRWRWLCIRSAS